MRQGHLEERRAALLKLSHDLGREDRLLVILGEGNTSTLIGQDTFLVKASGTNLATLREDDLVECKMSVLLPLLDHTDLSYADVDSALLACLTDSESKKPSIEALFHAYLLTLPGVEFIAHTHPLAVNQVLCSPHGREFAQHPLFPDEIVNCGVASAFVPYIDPGFRLARAVRMESERFVKDAGHTPRVILLENHGIITLGKTPQAVLAAMLMAEKAAKIWVGAAALGGPTFLSGEDAQRIAARPDERYRQRTQDEEHL